MDNHIPNQEEVAEITATQVADKDIAPKENPDDIEKKLKRPSIKTFFGKIERRILQIVSYSLIIHGVFNLYHEMIEIFYVLPHIPEIFEDLGYAEAGYASLYRRTILVTATAAIETIYGLAMLARFKELVHHLHIISGIVLLVISILLTFESRSFEELDAFDRIPETPTFRNLISAKSMHERLELFTNIND